jgi:putative nucleotidyltransferase-like protein
MRVQRGTGGTTLADPAQWQPAPRLDAVCGPALRLCARVALTPQQRVALTTAVARLEPENWDLLARLAARHGLGPLAFKHLAEAGLLPLAPPGVADALKAAYCQSLVANRVAWDELIACLAALERAGVPVLPFKGVVLAARYYGTPALRPTADIDLLIRPHDLPRAEAAIRASGYQPRPGWGRRLDDWVLRFRNLRFEKPDAPPLELHIALTRLPVYRVGLADRVIWGGARTVEVVDLSTRYLDQGDELRYLSAHYVAQHGGERLLWLADIAAILAALPATWDWPAFVTRTTALRMASPVLAALTLAAAELEAPLPEGARQALAAACATPAERAAWRQAHAKFSDLGRARDHLVTLGTAGERLAFVRGLAASAWRRGRRAVAPGGKVIGRFFSQPHAPRHPPPAESGSRDGANGAQ